MAQPFRRDGFTWLAYFFLAFYGYFLNILGPITPFLKDELRLSYTVSSLHFTAFAAGILLAGLGGHILVERIGRWYALWLGALGMSAGALLLVAGRSPIITIGAAFCMGLVGSLILVIVASALSDQHGEQRAVALSEANVVSSLVATAAPLIVGWVAQLPGGWRLALGFAALAPICMRLVFWKVTPPTPAARPAPQVSERKPLPGLFWVYWAALVLAVAVEFCMVFWSANFLENSLGMPKANAAQAVSLFLAGMILGRLAASRLVQQFPTRSLVLVTTLVASAGFLLFWMTGNMVLGLAGLFLTGLGVASLYPLILSLALGAATNQAVQASARTTLASGTAIFALPLVLGRLADAMGIRPAYGVVALLLMGVFLIIWIKGKKEVTERQPAL